jgi:hypothetical protein
VGVCPAGGQHVKGMSGDYTPMHTAEGAKPSAEAFRDPSLAGTSTRLTLPSATGDKRYDLKRYADISSAGLFHAISSVRISRSGSDCERSLYLFGGSSTTIPNTDLRRHVPYMMLNLRAPLPYIQDFHGDFLRVTLRAGGTSGETVVNDLASHSFGDRTTSVMLVDRWRDGKPETTISASDTFTFGWKTALAGVIPVIQFALGGGVAIAQIGDPVFTWVAFPPATPNVPNNFTYLILSQWFVFHAWGIGVNAWLMLYLRLSRDEGSGKLQLNIVDLDRYVWPGTGQGQMMSAIDSAKAGIMSGLSNAVGLILGNLAQVRCDDVYLLPGKQPNTKAALDGIVLQDAMSDVTIVLENQH